MMSAQALKNPSDIITATPEELRCLEKHYPLHYQVFQALLKQGRAEIVEVTG